MLPYSRPGIKTSLILRDQRYVIYRRGSFSLILTTRTSILFSASAADACMDTNDMPAFLTDPLFLLGFQELFHAGFPDVPQVFSG